MKTPLAWLNLIHSRVRTAVAVAGVTFAIILMFMQLGFLEAVKASATIIYDILDFDACIRSTDYLHFAEARSFPRIRLYQAQGVAGVSKVMPFHVALASWRNPHNGEKRIILTMGLRPEDDVFLDRRIRDAARQLLRGPEDMLIDTTTGADFGPTNRERFGEQDQGFETEVGGKRIRIVGHFRRGAGFSASGAMLINEGGFFPVASDHSADRVSLGLVKVNAGADLDQVVDRLRRELGDGVEVLSRRDTIQREINRWVKETNYGLVFRTGVLVALVVGTAIVYQVLASEVTTLLPEYATLKAMGYRDRYLAGVVLQQAVALALVGFVPGAVLSRIMYSVTAAGAGIPIRFTWGNFALVLILSLSMCMVSGLLAVRKTFKADPADLF
jgi:putative ABC transport system permease protein